MEIVIGRISRTIYDNDREGSTQNVEVLYILVFVLFINRKIGMIQINHCLKKLAVRKVRFIFKAT